METGTKETGIFDGELLKQPCSQYRKEEGTLSLVDLS